MVRYRPYLILVVLGLAAWLVIQKPVHKTYFIPFDEAQVQDHYAPIDLINFYQRLHKKKWRIVKRLYHAHLAGKKKRHTTTRIPKVIHLIWLDSPVPPHIRETHATWAAMHPDWEVHLWTSDEIAFLYLQNRPFYDETQSRKAKSEILRYEILYQFGGVFVENNIECLRPLDILNENLDFYAGLTDQIRTPRISAALIGSIPSHPVLHDCLRSLRIRRPDHPGSSFLTQCFLSRVKKRDRLASVALPATFFYPFPKEDREDYDLDSLYKTTFAIRRWNKPLD